MAAIPIVVGASVGTTSTGLIASLGMKPVARATAFANLLFKGMGVLAYFPFMRPFSRLMVDWFGAGAMSVAWALLVFSVTVGVTFSLLLDKVEPLIAKRSTARLMVGLTTFAWGRSAQPTEQWSNTCRRLRQWLCVKHKEQA